MGTERHRIRKQTLRVDIDSEDLALALQPRLQALNRTAFHEILERVLDEFALPGQHVRLDTVDIDLGTIPAAEVEAVATARLERELREALRKAMRAIETGPTPQQFVQSTAEARLDALEDYLLHGTLPFWATASDFSLDEEVAQAASSHADALVHLLRQHGADSRLRERLVRQLGQEGLQRLLQLLDPVHAALIIEDIRALQPLLGPGVGGGDAEVRQLLWGLVLADQLESRRDLPFTRSAFVRFLVEGAAEHAGVPYDELLTSLDDGRVETAESSSPTAPVAVVLRELRDGFRGVRHADGVAPWEPATATRVPGDEQPPGSAFAPYDYADILRYYLRHGLVPWSVALGGAEPPIATALEALPGFPLPIIRTVLASESPRERAGLLLRAVRGMSDQALARLLAALLGQARHDVASSWAVIAERVKEMTGDRSRRTDREISYARILAGLLDGEIAEWETFQASPAAQVVGDTGPVVWEPHRIKAVLAARARASRGVGSGEPPSTSLLHWLIERHPADARHFFRALHRAGLRPSALLDEPGPPSLVETSQALLPRETVASLALLLRVLAALPSADRLASEAHVRATAVRAVLDEAAVEVHDREWFLVRLLWQLLGPTVSASTVRALQDAVTRVMQAEDLAPEAAFAVRAALGSLSVGRDEGTQAAGPADVVASDTAAVARSVPSHAGVPEAAPPLPDGSRRSLEEVTQALPAEIAACLALLQEVLTALPATDRPGTEVQMRATMVRAVLDEAHVEALDRDRFLVGLLRRLVGPTVSASTVRALQDAATRVMQAEDLAPEATFALRAALGSLSVGRDERTPAAGPADVVASDTAAVARPVPSHAGVPEAAPPSPDGSRRSLEEVTQALPAEIAACLALLQEVLTALPATDRPGTEAQMRATMVRAVLDEAHVEALDRDRFLVGLLRRLFGPTVSASTEAAIRDAAGSLLGVEPSLAEPARRLRAAFKSMGIGLDDDGRMAGAPAVAPPPPEEPPSTHEPASMAAPASPDLERVPRLGEISPNRPAEADVRGSPEPVPSAEQAIAFARLRGTGPIPSAPPALDGLSDEASRETLLRSMLTMPDAIRDVVAGQLTDPHARARWVRDLSETELARIAYLIEPRWHRALLAAAELLFAAWSDVAVSRRIERADVWSFLLAMLAQTPVHERSLERLVAAFVAHAAMRELEGGPSGASERAMLGEHLLHTAARLAQQAGHASLRAVLLRGHQDLLQRWRVPTLPPPAARTPTPPGIGEPPPSRPRRRRMAFSMEGAAEATSHPIHIANAGLVITGAFLPRLFEGLEMLDQSDDGKRRVRPQRLSRAVHLLQYLVDGRTDVPEPLLCLNKILCGVALAAPIDRAIEATPREREMCDLLLTSVIANWPVLKSTTIPGLQETFLQREGRLERTATGWRLHVQRKTIDVLVDHIPWTVSTLALSWMPEPIFVTW